MEAVIQAIQEQYIAGAIKVGVAAIASPSALLVGPLLGLLPFFHSAESRRAVAQLEALQPRIERWRTVLFQRAVKGEREDGTPYSVDLFHMEGRDIAQVIQEATGEAFEGTLFRRVVTVAEDTGATVRDTVQTVEKVAGKVGDFVSKLPEALPDEEEVSRALFWLKVGGGALGVGALAVGVGYVVRAFR